MHFVDVHIDNLFNHSDCIYTQLIMQVNKYRILISGMQNESRQQWTADDHGLRPEATASNITTK